MPSRGRPPKPVAIHRLEGTYKLSRHEHRAREPHADGELAAYPAPAWKSDNRRRLWTQRLADVPKGPLRRADRQLFTNYVVLADRFERAAIAQNALDAGSSAPMLMRGTPAVVVSPSYVLIYEPGDSADEYAAGRAGIYAVGARPARRTRSAGRRAGEPAKDV